MTTLPFVDIHTGDEPPADPAVDYKDVILRAEVTRSINSVGFWQIMLRNIGGGYHSTFHVQDYFRLDVNNIGDTLIKGRVDGPAVNLHDIDLESIWDEYVILGGVDNAQDLLFHNDFSYKYPANATNTIEFILDDVFTTRLAGLTNIDYPLIIPIELVGSFEFREGASFLGQIQELMRRAGYVFYVSDDLIGTHYRLICSRPANMGNTGLTFTSQLGNPLNNILGGVEYQVEDGDKLYNYVRLYGKAPMFDGYTEYNAPDWAPQQILAPLWGFPGTTDGVINDDATVKVDGWSIVAYNTPAANGHIGMRLDTSPVIRRYNYDYWDFTDGEIGVWALYDHTAAAPGTPGAGFPASQMSLYCSVEDSAHSQAFYFGDSALLYVDTWGWCSFRLGEKSKTGITNIADAWNRITGPELIWDEIISFEFTSGLPNFCRPSHLYIDGLSLPFAIRGEGPTTAVIPGEPAWYTDARTSQTAHRRRPYIDTWAHLRAQYTIQQSADQVLRHSTLPDIKKISFVTPGNIALRYPGRRMRINIPSMNILNQEYYSTKLHHIIEPNKDISGGYGFDWIVEVEALPTAGTSYDHSRLDTGPTYSASQRLGKSDAGIRGS